MIGLPAGAFRSFLRSPQPRRRATIVKQQPRYRRRRRLLYGNLANHERRPIISRLHFATPLSIPSISISPSVIGNRFKKP